MTIWDTLRDNYEKTAENLNHQTQASKEYLSQKTKETKEFVNQKYEQTTELANRTYEKGRKIGKNLTNKDFLIGTALTVGSKVLKTFATTKLLSVGFKATGKMIPFVGNAIGAIDDIYQSYQISSLENTTASLKESQSVMEGQITDLQAGLKEAKDAKIELAEEQKRFQIELETATAENKAELELQKQALQEALEAQNEAEEHFQGCIDATNTQIDEVKNRMKDSEVVIKILQDTSLDQAEKTEQLKGIVAKEKERIDQFEKDMSVFNDRLTESEKKLAGHEEKINNLYDKHLELEAKVKKNTADIAENKEDIAENKSNITKNTADIAKNKENITKNEQAINTETQDRKAETGEIRKGVQENKEGIAKNEDQIKNLDKKFEQQKTETQTKNQELDNKIQKNKAENKELRKETQTKTHELDQKIQATQKEFTSQTGQLNTKIDKNTSSIDQIRQETTYLTREQEQAKRKQERAEKKLEQERKAREEAEEQARQREAKISTNKKNIEQLQVEIKDKSFQQAKIEDKLTKLLEYTRLKEEKVRLTKQLKEFENSLSWDDYERLQREQDKKLARQLASQNITRGMLLQPGCRWYRDWRKAGLTDEQIKEKHGWEPTEEKGDWQYWVEQIYQNREKWVETALVSHFFTDSTVATNSVNIEESPPSNLLINFSLVDARWKQKIVEKLAKNKKLFAEVCEELGLEVPAEEPIEISPKSNPLNQKVPNPTPNQASGSGTSQTTNQSDSNSKKNNASDKGVNKPINKPRSNSNPKENQNPEKVIASGSGTSHNNQSPSNRKPKVKKPKKEAPQNKEQPKKTPPKLGDLSFGQFFQVVCLPPVLRRPGTTQALQFPWWILIWIFFLLCLFYPQIWKLLKYLNKKLSEVQCEECGKKLQEFIDEEFALCQKCLWKQQKKSTKSPANKIVDNKDLKKVETQNYIRNVLAMSATSDSEKINKLTLLKNIQTSHLPATLAEQMAINKVINTLSDAIKDQELKVLKAEINKISLTNEEKDKLITAKDKFQAETIRTEANIRINENLTKEKTSLEPKQTEDLSQIQELLQPPQEPKSSEENSKAEELPIDEPATNTQLENWS